MKKYMLFAVVLAAGYLVTGCTNGGSGANGADAATTSNPSTGTAGAISGPGGTGPIDHGSAANGVGR